MDAKHIKQIRRKLGYEKSIQEQLHNEIFQTTSEHKYYELGMANGLYYVYQVFDNLIKNGYVDVKLDDLKNIIKQSANDNINIGELFNKMVDYDKEDKLDD